MYDSIITKKQDWFFKFWSKADHPHMCVFSYVCITLTLTYELDIRPWYSTLAEKFWRYTYVPKMKFVVKAFKI